MGSRLVFNGKAGNGTYLTMPSTCGSRPELDPEESTSLDRARAADEATFTTPHVGAAAATKFRSTRRIAVSTQGGAVDSPEPTTVDVGIPFDASTEPIANSYLKTAKVVLPEGMGINPSSAIGLVPCTDAQFEKGTERPDHLPRRFDDRHRRGGYAVAAGRLARRHRLRRRTVKNGPVRRAPENSSGSSSTPTRFATGSTFAWSAKSSPTRNRAAHRARRRQPAGDVQPLPAPPQRWPERTLTSPNTCGPNTTTTDLTPWAGNPDQNTPSS